MSKGFTLIELLVVTAIIVLLSALILPNYRTGDQQLALQRSSYKLAQDLRRAQELALSSQKFGEDIPAGYGAYFNVSDPTHYVLFADVDGDDAYDDPTEKVEKVDLEESIELSYLLPASPLTIIFSPPDPTTKFFPDATTASIVIEAKKLRMPLTQYTYQITWCSWLYSCWDWLTPRASCDTSQTTVNCPNYFSGSAGGAGVVYDQFQSWWFGNQSYKYQKQEMHSVISSQKTIEVNKAGLIANE